MNLVETRDCNHRDLFMLINEIINQISRLAAQRFPTIHKQLENSRQSANEQTSELISRIAAENLCLI